MKWDQVSLRVMALLPSYQVLQLVTVFLTHRRLTFGACIRLPGVTSIYLVIGWNSANILGNLRNFEIVPWSRIILVQVLLRFNLHIRKRINQNGSMACTMYMCFW